MHIVKKSTKIWTEHFQIFELWYAFVSKSNFAIYFFNKFMQTHYVPSPDYSLQTIKVLIALCDLPNNILKF